VYCVWCVEHGTVYAAGSNVNAQLGLGNQSPNVSTPARVCHPLLHSCSLYICDFIVQAQNGKTLRLYSSLAKRPNCKVLQNMKCPNVECLSHYKIKHNRCVCYLLTDGKMTLKTRRKCMVWWKCMTFCSIFLKCHWQQILCFAILPTICYLTEFDSQLTKLITNR